MMEGPVNHESSSGLNLTDHLTPESPLTTLEPPSQLEETTNTAAPLLTNITTSVQSLILSTLKQILEKNETSEFADDGRLSTSHFENNTLDKVTALPSPSSTIDSFPPSSSSLYSSSIDTDDQTGGIDLLSTLDVETTTRALIAGDDTQQASVIGIAVGVTIGVLVLLAIIAIIIFVFVRRRGQPLRKKKAEVVMENPQYTLDRNSTLPRNFDLTMHTGPMVRSELASNSTESLTRTNGKRKKDAPRPPIYRPGAGKDAGGKRKAPPPPKHLGYELYEKDSASGSAEGLELTSFYTADNQNAVGAAADSETSPSQPLLQSFQPAKKSPERNSKIDSGERTIEPDSAKDVDQEEDRNNDDEEQMRTALLGKTKSTSKTSIDSYDKEKNPFFDE